MCNTGSYTTLLYQFYGLLARQMFNIETNHQHAGKAALYFLLQTLVIVRIIAVAQRFLRIWPPLLR